MAKLYQKRLVTKNSIGEFFEPRIVNYQDPWQNSTDEEKDIFYIYNRQLKHTLDDSILYEESDDMSFEEIEGFKCLY